MALPAGKAAQRAPDDTHDQMANLDTGEFVNHHGHTRNIRHGDVSNIGAHTQLLKAGEVPGLAYRHKMHDTKTHKHLTRRTKNPHPHAIERRMLPHLQAAGGMLGPLPMGAGGAPPMGGGPPMLPMGAPGGVAG